MTEKKSNVKIRTHENFNYGFDQKAIYFKLRPHIIQFMEDHSPDFLQFLSIFSQFMAFPRCALNVHHFVASKPVLIWQSFESLFYIPLSGWLLFLLWWQFSVFHLFVDFPGIHCLWGNPTDKNLGVNVWWLRGPFHIVYSAYESLFKPLPQPINSFVGCMRCGTVLQKPLWTPPRRLSDSQYLFRTAI